MTFPSVVAPRGTSAALAASTSHAVTMPAGATTARGAIVVFSFDSALTATVSGTGWGEVAEATAATMGSVLVYKRPGVTLNALTINLFSGVVPTAEEGTYIVLPVDDAHPGEDITATPSAGAGANPDCPLHTPPGGARDYLWIVVHSVESTNVATAAPANYGALTTSLGGPSGASTATAERALNAASEDPGAWTADADDYVTWTIAVPPAPTGAPLPDQRRRRLRPLLVR